MALLFTALLGVSAALIGYYLIGQSREDFLREAQSLGHLRIAGIIIVALMSVVVLVSFVISRFVVNRINVIASTAREIMDTGDLSRRISIDTHWDDLSNLAQLLNSFLSRNELLMDGIREVSNNIAHDLRTPLTHLRQQIEELKSQDITESHIEGLLAEADQILGIFNSLLRISNIEKGKRLEAFEEIDISTLLGDVMEFYEPVAEEKDIRLTVQLPQGQKVKGDRNLLFQLFANIVSNAIKFSPHGAEVGVSIHPGKEEICAVIADRGPGVAAFERELVFRRFYRGDASRSTEGNGLGLSMAKAIIDLHRGAISLEDNTPGLRVKITFQPYQ